ncbi:hypothetical protein QQZ08_006308 [Neonectria magnoliae]|uniref:Uncharacterized protein n=1 Tax=Neonectria magnoliae TaxID=2732573 RepID=A0ABR1I119_9HYPO
MPDPPPCQKEADLSPPSSLAQYWGSNYTCPNLHQPPRLHGEELPGDAVWWIHLGNDAAPRSIREWLREDQRHLDVYYLRSFGFEPFCQAIGLTERELKDRRYMAKIPTEPQVIPCQSKFDFLSIAQDISIAQHFYPQFWCTSPAPVVIFCTEEQAKRCAAQGWLGAVQSEFARTVRSKESRKGAGDRSSGNPDGASSSHPIYLDD